MRKFICILLVLVSLSSLSANAVKEAASTVAGAVGTAAGAVAGAVGTAADTVADFAVDRFYDVVESMYEVETIIKEVFEEKMKGVKKIILGAETGNRKEKIIPKKEWIENIIRFAKEYNIELFLKENIKKYL